MGFWCLLLGHSPGCQCRRCGKIRHEHRWDGCQCTICGQVSHNWVIRNWTYDGQNYIFEKECGKCKEKTKCTEQVPFGKIVLG